MMKTIHRNPFLYLLFALCVLAGRTVTQHDPHASHDPDGHDHVHHETAHKDEDHSDHDHENHDEDDHPHDHDHDEHAHDDAEEHQEDGHEGHDHDYDHGEEGIHLDAEVMEEFGIDLSTAETGRLERHIRLPGEVLFNQNDTAHIVPRYAGLVIQVLKTKGDTVEKGDVLAKIEGNDSLARYDLTSLIDGTIIDRHITVGESVNEDDTVFLVSNLDRVWIDLAVFQQDLSDIKVGQSVFLSGGTDSLSGTGVIQYVSPTLDKHTRTGLARMVLSNEGRKWKPGMFISGDVSIPSDKETVLIPRDAVLMIEGTHAVFVMNDENALEPRSVQLGRQEDGIVEILSGLEAGERFASSHVLPLKAELNRSALEHAGHAH